MQRRVRLNNVVRSALLAGIGLGVCLPVQAQDVLRIATWNTELTRKGPGLLLRDIAKGTDPQVLGVLSQVQAIDPDILILTGFDTDMQGHALAAFQSALSQLGQPYPHRFTKLGNAGKPTGFDLDLDGRLGEAEDAQSYGRFRGVGGMAILSRLPIVEDEIVDFTSLLWRDVPGALVSPHFWSEDVLNILRLSSNNHWDVPFIWNDAPLHVFAFHASTPVFDGEEDRNGRRNSDEIGLWLKYLDGELAVPAPIGSFVIAGDANLDPSDGEGRKAIIQQLLSDPRVQDPKPRSEQGNLPANPDHRGDPALDTADWREPNPGNLRVDYVLPSSDLHVIDAGVAWSGQDEGTVNSRHGLVWVDIAQIP